MAKRDLDFNQDIVDVAAEKPDDTLTQLAGFAAELADTSVKSKILDATSQAQVGFKQLDAQHRIKYEGDPNNEEGLKELQAARQQLTEQLGGGISSLYMRQWNDSVGKLASSSDISNGIWAIEQNHRNVKENVNKSLKNYLEMASADGQAFGASSSNDASTLLNYSTAHAALQDFGDEALGSETTAKLLDSFAEDYLKSAISGVAITNPSKAAKLMSDPAVAARLSKDPEQFLKFRTSIENRAKHFEKNNGQKEIINRMRDDTAPLADGGTMSYAKFASTKMSDTAREYYAGLNGFSSGSGKRGGFTPEDKAKYSLAIIESVQKLATDDNMDADSVRVVQDSIFKAMNKGAISQSEGMGYIKQIVEPLNAKKEAAMSKFSVNKWLDDDIGFTGIQDYFEKNVEKPVDGLSPSTVTEVQVKNRINKSNLYDAYTVSLNTQAEQLGTTVIGLQDLPKSKREQVYAKAQTEAIRTYTLTKHPALRTLPDVTNMIYSADGQLVQGMVGPRNVKATGGATAPFKIQRNKKTGEQRRVYPDGRMEPIK